MKKLKAIMVGIFGFGLGGVSVPIVMTAFEHSVHTGVWTIISILYVFVYSVYAVPIIDDEEAANDAE